MPRQAKRHSLGPQRVQTNNVRPVPRKVYTEKQPGIQPGGDSSGYTDLGTALAAAAAGARAAAAYYSFIPEFV